jgi:hypothetical protein
MVGGNGKKFAAFSRDISPAGIGLLHRTPLDTSRLNLSIPWTSGHPLDVRTDIRWCAPAGEGWYLSGGKFLKSSFRQVIAFLFSALKAEADQRVSQRYPFFRPVTITIGGCGGKKVSAFSRDISPSGIGLLHSMPLDTDRLRLSIPWTEGHPLEIRTDIRWCAPAGEGWYLSGGRFVPLVLEKLPCRLM